MAEMQKVSWRTVCYAALGTAAVIAATIGIVHSDGVRPTSLKSSAATRWLVYRPQHLLVLADGLSGHVLAKIDADPNSDATGEFALQGAAGAFLISPSLGSVRAISTANLRVGHATAGRLADGRHRPTRHRRGQQRPHRGQPHGARGQHRRCRRRHPHHHGAQVEQRAGRPRRKRLDVHADRRDATSASTTAASGSPSAVRSTTPPPSGPGASRWIARTARCTGSAAATSRSPRSPTLPMPCCN